MFAARRVSLAVLAVVLGLAFTGCSSTLYRWGSYEPSVLALQTGFEDSTLLQQISRLERDVEESLSEDRRAPPGLHGHLGYLHYLAGDSEAALRHFREEKALYPQSAVFMDGLMGRL